MIDKTKNGEFSNFVLLDASCNIVNCKYELLVCIVHKTKFVRTILRSETIDLLRFL